MGHREKLYLTYRTASFILHWAWSFLKEGLSQKAEGLLGVPYPSFRKDPAEQDGRSSKPAPSALS